MKLVRALIPDMAVLQAFECAARHGSFTQAAAELNLTQSAVSRQIRTLETQLGITLFERIRKRVVLSSTGSMLLPEVVRLLNQAEEVVSRAMASVDGQRTLTVATLPTFGNRWLMRRLPAFLRTHPKTILNVVSRSEPFDLAAEDIDLVIHYGQPVWAHATCTYLCKEEVLPVGSPELVGSSEVFEPSHLSTAPLLHLTTRPKLWTEWFQSNGCEGMAVYSGHRFDQFSMIIEAAVQGLGFALLPRYLIEDEIGSGRLEIALDMPLFTTNSYYLVTPDSNRGSPASLQFQEWLLNEVLES